MEHETLNTKQTAQLGIGGVINSAYIAKNKEGDEICVLSINLADALDKLANYCDGKYYIEKCRSYDVLI